MNFPAGSAPYHHLDHHPLAAVNDFLSLPANFEQWAAGLGNGFHQLNGEWVFGNPNAPVSQIRFHRQNGNLASPITSSIRNRMSRFMCRCASSRMGMAVK